MLKVDTHGNKLYTKPLKKGAAVFIYLAQNKETRKIGTYYEDKNLLSVKRDRDEHFHVKSQSYGFSHILLQTLDPETQVMLQEKGGRIKYMTSVLDIIEKGKFLFFLEKGYEKQVFMPIDLFKVTV